MKEQLQDLISDWESEIQKASKLFNTVSDDQWLRGKISAKRLIISRLEKILKDNEVNNPIKNRTS